MSKLFSPIQIGSLTFKNRIMMPPMCMYHCANEDGIISRDHRHHYYAHALGGVAGIVVEATMINPQAGISRNDLGIYNAEQIAAFKKLVAGVHAHNCLIGIQLNHAGRKAKGYAEIYAPSPIAFMEGEQIPKELTVAEINSLVADFTKAALNAEAAGFDFVEIHAAHGYLLSEFLSPVSNHRNDNYGGSLENRYRFLHEVITSIKQAGFSKDLHLRISANEVEETGNSLAEITKILKWAQADGICFNSISGGGLTAKAPDPIYPGYQAGIAQKLAETGLAVGAVGLLDRPELCEFLVRDCGISICYLGRASLRNPFWPYEAAITLHEAAANIDLFSPSYLRAMPFKH